MELLQDLAPGYPLAEDRRANPDLWDEDLVMDRTLPPAAGALVRTSWALLLVVAPPLPLHIPDIVRAFADHGHLGARLLNCQLALAFSYRFLWLAYLYAMVRGRAAGQSRPDEHAGALGAG